MAAERARSVTVASMRFVTCILLSLSISRAAPAAGPVVLKAHRMFDGRSDRIVTPGLVVVVAGKIQGTGEGAPAPAPFGSLR